MTDWTVCFPEVRCEEHIEEGAGQTFDGVGKREDCDTLGLIGMSVTVIDDQMSEAQKILTYLISGHG